MLCTKCKKNKVAINLKHLKPLCKYCFCTIIEKRIRKYIRINKIFKKNDKILVIGDLCFYLVKKIIKDMPSTIIKRDKPKRKKGYKIVIPPTLDDIISSFLLFIFYNKKIKLLNSKNSKGLEMSEKRSFSEHIQMSKKQGFFEHSQKSKISDESSIFDDSKNFQNKNSYIKILRNITDEEAELFSKFKKLKFNKNEKNLEIKNMLNRLEDKYPGTKFSLLKSFDQLN